MNADTPDTSLPAPSANQDLATQARNIDDFAGNEARTYHFRFGAPRTPQIIGGGSRMLFLRSDSATSPVTSLWIKLADGSEVKLADPRDLISADDGGSVPPEELARRQRAREANSGIVEYGVDSKGEHVVFTIDDELFVTTLEGADSSLSTHTERIEPVFEEGEERWRTPILNPRISPDGKFAAYSADSALMVIDLQTKHAHAVLSLDDFGEHDSESEDRHIGLAEFVAAEEMDRYMGFWWAPDGSGLLVEMYDASEEPYWYISNPTDPTQAAVPRRYPQALQHNAIVSLYHVSLKSDGACAAVAQVEWDSKTYPYMAAVQWCPGQKPVLLVFNREQTDTQVLEVELPDASEPSASSDNASVSTSPLIEEHNDQWIDVVLGTPARTPQGKLVTAVNSMERDTNALKVDGKVFTPEGWQIRQVFGVYDEGVLCQVQRTPEMVPASELPQEWANEADLHDARSYDVAFLDYHGNITPLNAKAGMWSAFMSGGSVVLSGTSMANPNVQMSFVPCANASATIVGSVEAAAQAIATGTSSTAEENANPVVKPLTVETHAQTPGFTPNVHFTRLGEDKLFTAIVAPSASSKYAGAESLPVLMKPYSGPGVQEVCLSQSYYWQSQWWADQGFLVVTTDGHGTTGRGPKWDRAVNNAMKSVTLRDQVNAVEALAGAVQELNSALEEGESPLPMPKLDKVSMIGWSYGGFLSALAVLDAPETFAAACAGAPPVDWTLYDTFYTERFLGLDPQVYEENSILDDAPKLERPLMLIHGFADDNVTIANSLRLSQRLMEAGRPHTYLPLTGITHMTNEPAVAKNLLLLQRDFLKEALGL